MAQYGKRVMTLPRTARTLDRMDELLILRLRLQRACDRRDAQPAYSPDWDAAMAEIEEVTQRVWHFVPEDRREPVAAHR